MIERIIAVLLFFVLFVGCKKEQNVEALQKRVFETLKSNPPKIPKEKFLNVHFGPNINLKWDVDQSMLIEDSEYDSIKKDAQKISILMNNISNDEDLNVKVCLKKENLKKGDVAFIYLSGIGKAPAALCFGIQYDSLDEECSFPNGILDYLEKERVWAKNKVIACQKELNH